MYKWEEFKEGRIPMGEKLLRRNDKKRKSESGTLESNRNRGVSRNTVDQNKYLNKMTGAVARGTFPCVSDLVGKKGNFQGGEREM